MIVVSVKEGDAAIKFCESKGHDGASAVDMFSYTKVVKNVTYYQCWDAAIPENTITWEART
jgi:hypothetical protein